MNSDNYEVINSGDTYYIQKTEYRPTKNYIFKTFLEAKEEIIRRSEIDLLKAKRRLEYVRGLKESDVRPDDPNCSCAPKVEPEDIFEKGDRVVLGNTNAHNYDYKDKKALVVEVINESRYVYDRCSYMVELENGEVVGPFSPREMYLTSARKL